ncbi:MAG: Mut7-C RNAse domain-containing protein [Sphingomonadales bacterium]
MRLLCDEMVHRLGRWLRAAGYDTLIMEPGVSDRVLVSKAAAENRLILTRDKKIPEIKAARGRILLLEGDGVEGWVAQVSRQLNVNWLYRPFSRCLICNAKITPAPQGLLTRLPPRARDFGHGATYCRDCNKLYWPGSHHRRMQQVLESWRRRHGTPGRP